MGPWLESLVPWGTEFIKMVQTYHNPVLTAFFKSITVLGDEAGYILFLPLLYWSLDARTGRRTGVLIFLSLSFNAVFKAIFHIPRPLATKVKVMVHEVSPSFPSGHAQGSLTLWGYLAVCWKRLPFRIAVLLLLPAIGLSRMYLGVHFPQDILGGWTFGLIFLVLFVLLEPKLTPKIASMPLWGQLLLAAIPPLILVAIYPQYHVIPAVGSWFGFQIGIALERHHVRFSSKGSTKQRALRYSAILLVIACFILPKLLLPSTTPWRFLRYASMGFVAAYIAPILFLRLGLAQREDS